MLTGKFALDISHILVATQEKFNQLDPLQPRR